MSGDCRKRWDIFCKVVDNFGDIGICWRLARQLAAEHDLEVRLWVDHLPTFARLSPAVDTHVASQRVGSIEVRHWSPEFPTDVTPGDVVIEAFACELPPAYLTAMAASSTRSVWINLEYLSAEPWIEGCHGLSSPAVGNLPVKYFFFPGFAPGTGGLLRERRLLEERDLFNSTTATAFLAGLGVQRFEPDEVLVSLFAYENNALPQLVECWQSGSGPIRLLTTACAAAEQIQREINVTLAPGEVSQLGQLRLQAIPFLSQPDYDRLLWACDLNFVRGEDSFVRAQWAQRPFVWQIYPQSENAHWPKLDAFLDRYLASRRQQPSVSPAHDPIQRGMRDPVAPAVRDFWYAWNGSGDISRAWGNFLENQQSIDEHGKVWARELDRAGNLADNLARFVSER